MNMQQLKNKIWKACEVLEHADFDLSEMEVEFDIDIRYIDTHGLTNDITNISFNMLEENSKVRIMIE